MRSGPVVNYARRELSAIKTLADPFENSVLKNSLLMSLVLEEGVEPSRA